MDCKEIREMYKLMFAEYRLQNPQNQCDQLCSEKSVRSEARERVGATLILARAPPRLK